MIITRNGSLIPRVFFGSAGQVMYVVLFHEKETEFFFYLNVSIDFMEY